MKTTKLETSDLKGVKVQLNKAMNTTKTQLLNDVNLVGANMKDKVVALDMNLVLESLNLVKENLLLLNENLVLVNRNLELVQQNLLLVKENLVTKTRVLVNEEVLTQVDAMHQNLKTKMVNANHIVDRKTK